MTRSNTVAASYPPSIGTACRLTSGQPGVVPRSEAAPAGPCPAGGRPPLPHPAGDPESSGESVHESRAKAHEAWCERLWNPVRADAAAWSAKLARLKADLRPIDICSMHSEFRSQMTAAFPVPIQAELLSRYKKIAGMKRIALVGRDRDRAFEARRATDNWAQANQDLRCDSTLLRDAKAHLVTDDAELRRMADRHAWEIRRAKSRTNDRDAYALGREIAVTVSVTPPEPKEGKLSMASCVNRLTDSGWWHRTLRRSYARRAEEAQRHLGFVHRNAGLYLSDASLFANLNRRVCNRSLLERAIACNDEGQSFSLAELADLSVSNPVLRRNELMTRARGLETCAAATNLSSVFITLTLPSRYHRASATSGARNPSYDGSTPRDGQLWLTKRWARLRAAFHRERIQIFGLRVAEPHHDGTPHWHLLLHVDRARIERLKELSIRYFLESDCPDEPGARAHRVKFTMIDRHRGDGAGYIAKYVSKNIDGYEVGPDFEDTGRQRSAAVTAVRVAAWASTHCIRQFQFIGGPPVGVYRELRRLSRSTTGVLEQARTAADGGEWAAYVDVMGGATGSRRAHPVVLYVAWSDKPGRYGDPVGELVLGLRAGDLVEITRERQWTIDWRGSRNPPPALH